MNDVEYDEYFLQERIGICKPKKWIIQGLLKQDYRMERIRIIGINDVQRLAENYIVWYTINDNGLSGWDHQGSMNYKVNEFIEDLSQLRGLPNHEHEISGLNLVRESLRTGLTTNVTIRVAHDTFLNKQIIVDGTKRAVSLCTFLGEDLQVLSLLINSEFRIEILKLTSKYCHAVFPCDFNKFY